MKKTLKKKTKGSPKKITTKGAKKKTVKAASPVKKAAPKLAQASSKAKGPAPKAVAKVAASPKATPAKAPKGKKIEAATVIAALKQAEEAEIILTNADGKQYCRVHDCDNESTTEGYCRFHYLALWKRNKVKAKILQGGKLDKYIEDLTAKYPDKYLEMLRKDLASEKDFNSIVAEMDVEDSGDEADNEEETSRFIEEVRGGIPTPDDDEGGF